MARNIKAPRGNDIVCKNWRIEAIYRMLHNNLENAERPEDLIIYGGTGKAARNWECFDAIIKSLRELEPDETLLIQSGKPVGVFRTFENSPRVLICNSNLVGNWSNWEHFNALEARGLMMYGQMTAGSWCYIGTQGIIQGTYETFAALATKHFNGSLKGKFCLSGGMGGMSGAQPLSIKMAGGVALVVEVDPKRIQRRLDAGFCDYMTHDFHESMEMVKSAVQEKKAISIGLVGNCADVLPDMLAKGIIPDVVTDQTSAHDELNGYVPAGYWGGNLGDCDDFRKSDPKGYVEKSMKSMKIHCKAMVDMQKRGAVAFDYGNNLRGQAQKAGFADAFAYPGFVLAYVRPLFCEGRGPFRWIAQSGDPNDILATDKAIVEMFPENKLLMNWIELAEEYLPWEGLPARVCWLGYGERHKFAKHMNGMVRSGEIGPISITRDHLDSGSVASPYRETEGMMDGTDAIADWPMLNALLNCASGADMVALHNGGGVGIGLSQHSGMIVVCDGSKETDERIERVFKSDPGTGVMRHADAGYELAKKTAREKGVKIPMLS
ncbi:MAG: urocanate hydratase [Candidatus Thermoplasmatota archaeon]|nr:urocanate hydratase [Euryarchaeota archaeon]MBU4032021.1 urocanate hydratase [Candidatus Thermoplasmatota archaeon]MBU4071630.1 urocanate hydratase [Candidatus Thermoplasmatota archaeon]MBU4143890.1 urocanate hydratase [Candidatus Thermoplasmatota archaeon]MBU4592501.1 urocanate hydratase [Candidatus Thermoplasmatota archaeon]